MANLEQFELNIADLASDLLDAEVGKSVTQQQKYIGNQIAAFINAYPDQLRDVYYTESNTTELVEFIKKTREDVAQNPSDYEKSIEPSLATVEADVLLLEDQRLRIADWLGRFLPKRKQPEAMGRAVVSSLVRRPDLSYSVDDVEEAEKIIAANEAARQRQIKLELRAAEEAEPLQSDVLMLIADGVFKIMSEAAAQQKWLRKTDVYNSEAFRSLPQLRRASHETVQSAFHDAWEILEAWFQDYDPSYELFANDGGNTRSRHYLMSDPELAETVWDAEEEGQEPAVEDGKSLISSDVRITGIHGQFITLEDNTTVTLEDPIQQVAFLKLWELRKDAYISLGRLIQDTADTMDRPRRLVEPSVRNLFSKLGPSLERHYSRKRSKLLTRIEMSSRAAK